MPIRAGPDFGAPAEGMTADGPLRQSSGPSGRLAGATAAERVRSDAVDARPRRGAASQSQAPDGRAAAPCGPPAASSAGPGLRRASGSAGARHSLRPASLQPSRSGILLGRGPPGRRPARSIRRRGGSRAPPRRAVSGRARLRPGACSEPCRRRPWWRIGTGTRLCPAVRVRAVLPARAAGRRAARRPVRPVGGARPVSRSAQLRSGELHAVSGPPWLSRAGARLRPAHRRRRLARDARLQRLGASGRGLRRPARLRHRAGRLRCERL